MPTRAPTSSAVRRAQASALAGRSIEVIRVESSCVSPSASTDARSSAEVAPLSLDGRVVGKFSPEPDPFPGADETLADQLHC
jgi:hypothetical protein